MMPVFSSRVNGTLVHLLCARLGKARKLPGCIIPCILPRCNCDTYPHRLPGRGQAPPLPCTGKCRASCRVGAGLAPALVAPIAPTLLNSDFRADLGHLVSDALG